MRRISIIIILLLTYIGQQKLLSQSLYPAYGVGAGYSSASGGGIVFSMELDPRWALKASGFPYFYDNSDNTSRQDTSSGFKERNLNLGFELQYNFYKGLTNRFYALVGGSVWDIELTHVHSGKTNEIRWERSEKRGDRIYNFGLGAGWQWKFASSWSASIDAQYLRQSSDATRGVSEFFDRSPGGKAYDGLGVGISLQFLMR